MKGLIRFSINHPVPTIVFFLFALTFGIVSLTRLPLDLYPAMEFPMAVVATSYEGAGPQEVESLVTRPIEEAMGTVAGVTGVSSTSSEGQSIVIVEFDYGTDMDQATLSMRERVDQVKAYLPDGADTPSVFKVNPQAMPVLTVALSGPDDLLELRQLAEEQVKPRLERIDGVASVSITGGTSREIQVIVDPARLQAAGLSIQQVAQALMYENLNLPGGQVDEGSFELLVRTLGQFQSIEDIENVRLGAIRLGDVAEVRDGQAEITGMVWVDGRPAVSLDIQKQSGANSVAVANAVKAALADLEQELPGEISTRVLMDQSRMVVTSIESIASSGVQGGILAILVLLLFLQHLPATFVVALAIPISVFVAFGPLFMSGVTLNMISMGGLSLGIGMMVDSAIVVLENIFRHKEMGKDVYEAAVDGTAEVGLAVTASTLTTVVVFLPVIWVTGLAQIFFKELSLAVTFSLLASLMVSITLVPLGATWLLRDRPPRKASPWRERLARVGSRISAKFEALNMFYRRLLEWALQHRWQVVGIGFSSLAVAVLVATRMGMEFLPNMDTSEFRVDISMPAGTTLEQTQQVVEEAVAQIETIPELAGLYVSVGSSAGGISTSTSGSHKGYIVGTVVSPSERRRSLDEIMEEVRSRLVLPGAEVQVASSGVMDTGGNDIEIQVMGENLDILSDLADQILLEASQVPGTRELKTSVSEGLPEVQVRVDRAHAATYGLTASQIASAVQAAVRGQVVSQYRVGGEEFDIRLQATEESRRSVQALAQLPIATPYGGSVPLGEVAEVIRSTGPTTVERQDQARVVKVTGQIYGRDLASVTSDIRERLKKLPLPPGYSISYGGQNELMEESFGGLAQALTFSIVLVYLVMAAQFESFAQPLVLLTSVPLSFVGAVLSLVLTGRSLDISGMIGIILLVGIVVNNGIVLIDYINQLRRSGMERDEAVKQAGPTRLRPVLMTTLTTLLGLFPLALGLGEGAELQAPMATVVMGGLMLSTLLTLLVVPVVYTLMDDFILWVQRRFGRSLAQSA